MDAAWETMIAKVPPTLMEKWASPMRWQPETPSFGAEDSAPAHLAMG